MLVHNTNDSVEEISILMNKLEAEHQKWVALDDELNQSISNKIEIETAQEEFESLLNNLDKDKSFDNKNSNNPLPILITSNKSNKENILNPYFIGYNNI